MRVTVIGAGYVGLSSALALAYVGHDVVCVERDRSKLEKLRRSQDPLGEPSVADLLRETHVAFVESDAGMGDSDVIIVGVGTPPLADGRPDNSQIEEAARAIAPLARTSAVVLVRSTVAVGTCDALQSGVLRRQLVVSNPEFLREGRAIHDTFAPDRVVAGGPSQARATVMSLYQSILQGRKPEGIDRPTATPPFLWMDSRSSELTKYAANAFLATKLSFANEIANLAGLVDADARTVLAAVGLDPRIGRGHLDPSLGWGGGCLPKDSRALQALAAEYEYSFMVLTAAIEQNERQLDAFAQAVAEETARGGKVGLLGLAFKAQTADTRESPALNLARRLHDLGFLVTAYDPVVRELPAGSPPVTVKSDPFDACTGVDTVVVATEWPEFKELDLDRLRAVTRGGTLFDGRGVIDRDRAESAGFRYRGIGRRAPEVALVAANGSGGLPSRR